MVAVPTILIPDHLNKDNVKANDETDEDNPDYDRNPEPMVLLLARLLRDLIQPTQLLDVDDVLEVLKVFVVV